MSLTSDAAALKAALEMVQRIQSELSAITPGGIPPAHWNRLQQAKSALQTLAAQLRYVV